MSTVIAKNVQIGTSGTATDNFTIFQPVTPDGTLRIGNGNTGVTTSQVALTSDGLFQFNSGYGSVATAYGCRAWVNFNGTGTVAIRASGNVSSITDNGTGDYTVNFTAALTDANYAPVINAAPSDNQRNNVTVGLSANGAPTLAPEGNTKFAGSFRMQTGYPGSTTFVDYVSVYVAVFR